MQQKDWLKKDAESKNKQTKNAIKTMKIWRKPMEQVRWQPSRQSSYLHLDTDIHKTVFGW